MGVPKYVNSYGITAGNSDAGEVVVHFANRYSAMEPNGESNEPKQNIEEVASIVMTKYNARRFAEILLNVLNTADENANTIDPNITGPDLFK